MNPFVPSINISGALGQVASDGVTYVPSVLNGFFTKRLVSEILCGSFDAIQDTSLTGVDQAFFRLRLGGQIPFLLELLRKELVGLIRRDDPGVENLAYFEPNDVVVCMYDRTFKHGITSHKDEKRYSLLVATITLMGHADLVASSDREHKHVVGSHRTSPGGLMLLRGPGLGRVDDGRLFHSIGCPIGDARISVGFRMNTKA